MRTVGWIGSMIVGMAAVAFPQDGAKDLFRKGLERSARAGGLRIEGEVKSESPFGRFGIKLPGFEGVEGSFTAAVGTNGAVVLKLEGESGSYEVFRKGDRTVQRQTWTGKRPGFGSFAHEVTAALPVNLLKHLESAGEFQWSGERRIADVDCTGLQAVYPGWIIPEGEDEAIGLGVRMFDVQRASIALWVGKEDFQIRKIECKISKGLSSILRLGSALGKGDEKEEGLGFSSTYTLTVTSYEPDAEVKFPPEIAKLFQE